MSLEDSFNFPYEDNPFEYEKPFPRYISEDRCKRKCIKGEILEIGQVANEVINDILSWSICFGDIQTEDTVWVPKGSIVRELETNKEYIIDYKNFPNEECFRKRFLVEEVHKSLIERIYKKLKQKTKTRN